MDKRGLGPEMFVAIVLTVVGAIVLLGVFNLFATRLPTEAGQIVCKNSIAARANLALSVGVALTKDTYIKMKTVPLLCKTQDVKLSGTKEEINKQLADLMAICWWTFSEGKYDFTIENFFSGDTCFPCFTATIKDIKDADVITWTEYENWVRTHDYTIKNTTYFNYLTNYEGTQGALAFFDDVSEKKTYNILYSDPRDRFLKHGVPNGIYFADINNPPQTWGIGLRSINIPRKCTIITGIEGE